MLKDSKAQCDFLVVGLQTDPTLNEEYRLKTGGKNKNKPIQDYNERLIQIDGCKYVDYIVKYESEDELYNIIKEIIKKFQSCIEFAKTPISEENTERITKLIDGLESVGNVTELIQLLKVG